MVSLLSSMSLEANNNTNINNNIKDNSERGDGIPTEELVIKSYLLHNQASMSQFPSAVFLKNNWDFYLALGLFRISCIMTGIIARSSQGNASRGSNAGAIFAQIVPILAKRGVALLSSKSLASSQQQTKGSSSSSNRVARGTTLNEIRNGYPISPGASECLLRLRTFIDDECIPMETR